MKEIEGIVQRFGKVVSDSEKFTLQDIERGDIQDEPGITNRFLTTLETRINEFGTIVLGVSGIQIRSKILTDRGIESQESKFGADFAVLLEINVPNFTLKKGFLCQAKREGNGIEILNDSLIWFRHSNRRMELKGQVHKMLDISQASYVLIYGSRGFVMVPGSSIYGLTGNDAVYSKSVINFFKEFLMCFIGDMRLSTDHDDWDQIRKNVKKVIKITIEQENEKNPKEKDNENPQDFRLNLMNRQNKTTDALRA